MESGRRIVNYHESDDTYTVPEGTRLFLNVGAPVPDCTALRFTRNQPAWSPS